MRQHPSELFHLPKEEILRLIRDPDPWLRGQAMLICTDRGYDTADSVEAVLDAVENDPSDAVRLDATAVVLKLALYAATPSVIKNLGSNSPPLRALSCRALRKLLSHDLTRLLSCIRPLCDDPHPAVSRMAYRCLKEADLVDHELDALGSSNTPDDPDAPK